MQLSSIFSSGVNRRILLKKIPNRPIQILYLFFNICFLILIFSTPILQGIHTNFSEQQQQQQIPNSSIKKLRKLPHVFNTVLELPFRSDADVVVEEKEELFRFVAKMELQGAVDGQVRAKAVKIYPGIIKIIVIKGSTGDDKVLLEQVNVDTWRYRLPASTIPELAKAAFVDGELIVTVPKGDRAGRGEFGDGSTGVWEGGGRLVLVQ